MKTKLIKICTIIVLLVMVLLFGWMCLSVKGKKIEGGGLFNNMKVDYIDEYFKNFDDGVNFKGTFNTFNTYDNFDSFDSFDSYDIHDTLKTFNVFDTHDSHDLKFNPKFDSHDSRINIFDDDYNDSTTSNIKTFNIDALNTTDKSSPIVSSSFETVQYDI